MALAAAEPAQVRPRFLRDTMELEEALASVRASPSITQETSEKRFSVRNAMLNTKREISGFKHYPETALTCVALVCVLIFLAIRSAPETSMYPVAPEARYSQTALRLNFVGLGGCWGNTCQSLLNLKPAPAVAIANEPSGEASFDGLHAQQAVVSTEEEVPDEDQPGNAVVITGELPPGISLSNPSDDAHAATNVETGETLPKTDGLDVESNPRYQAAGQPEVLSPPAPQNEPEPANVPAKVKTATKTADPNPPRRTAPAQPVQKPALRTASKPSSRKRGIAQPIAEAAPAAPKVAAPAAKPPLAIATAKASPEPSQSSQGDPAPGFQILNNLNAEFFSFQP
jgi:hypothetical protein